MWIYTKLLKLSYKIENNNIISSIRKGFILLIPVFLIGAFSVLIQNFPSALFQEFLRGWQGGILYRILEILFDSTVGFMAVYLVISISYYYSETVKEEHLFLRIIAAIVSMVCFVISFGGAGGSMELADFGPVGVFTAIFTAILGTRLFYLFCGWLSSEFRFHSHGSDSDYRNSFSTLVPFLLCCMVFIAINLMIQKLLHQENFNDLITNAIIRLFNYLSGELPVGIVYIFVLNFLWAFGIHGGNAMEQVAQAYLVPADASSNIISKSFLDNFALIGGCGTSICLLAALLLFSRNRGNRQLAKAASLGVIFNINEILVYGIPLVLNPVFILPFILTPLLSLLIAYGATAMKLMPVVMTTVPWTTPVLFSGYQATGSIAGVLVQMVIVCVGTAVYAPFVKISDQIRKNQAKLILDELTDFYKSSQAEGKPCRLLNRHDSLGVLAKSLTAQLRMEVDSGKITLGYQPQYHYERGMIGAEALLRWRYMDQTVFPPLIVALSQEDGFYNKLTWCVIETAMADCRRALEMGKEITVSVNVSAEQLDSKSFIDQVIEMAHEAGVAGHFGLEVTEETSVVVMQSISSNIRRLRENCIMVSVDDFSMGRTSLNYLKDNRFDMVKLDGELVRQIIGNRRIKEIVSSILQLGKNLEFDVLAEYVENQEIRDVLHDLGCDLYQGYFYSPAVPFDELWKEPELEKKS